MVGGGAVGAVGWLARHRDQPFGKVVESYAYYLNPFEWWAYSRDDHWPPTGKVPGIGWRPTGRAQLRRSRPFRPVIGGLRTFRPVGGTTAGPR
jgi:hypothetical protein